MIRLRQFMRFSSFRNDWADSAERTFQQVPVLFSKEDFCFYIYLPADCYHSFVSPVLIGIITWCITLITSSCREAVHFSLRSSIIIINTCLRSWAHVVHRAGSAGRSWIHSCFSFKLHPCFIIFLFLSFRKNVYFKLAYSVFYSHDCSNCV